MATIQSIKCFKMNNSKLLVALILLFASHCCRSLLLHPHQQLPPAAAIEFLRFDPPPTTTIQRQFSGTFPSTPSPPSSAILDGSLLLSAADANVRNAPPPPARTQSEQMYDATAIATVRGTQWRVIEERYLSSPDASFGRDSPKICKSLVTFSGFASDANKGTVAVDYTCGAGMRGDGGVEDASALPPSSPATSKPSRGRWVTKPYRIKRGSVQLSARWKVRPPGEGAAPVIYKGYIDAERMIGGAGKSVSAEMVGQLITGEEVGKEKVIGKFTADLVRQLGKDEVDAMKIGGGGSYDDSRNDSSGNAGPITLSLVEW